MYWTTAANPNPGQDYIYFTTTLTSYIHYLKLWCIIRFITVLDSIYYNLTFWRRTVCIIIILTAGLLKVYFMLLYLYFYFKVRHLDAAHTNMHTLLHSESSVCTQCKIFLGILKINIVISINILSSYLFCHILHFFSLSASFCLKMDLCSAALKGWMSPSTSPLTNVLYFVEYIPSFAT